MYMSVKRLGLISLLVTLPMFAGNALAQKAPSSGTTLTVSKTTGNDDPDGGMFTTVQAAINAAIDYDVIEILDEETYEEQIVIDGRVNHPWTGNDAVRNKAGAVVNIVGGKKNITLRYMATQANSARPVIMWRDTVNRSPRNSTHAGTPGDTLGSSGNFETCGAVRIMRTTGITIEGIIIDGGGSRPWGYSGIWGGQHPVIFGNAAVAIAVAGNVQIRDCELRNAYIGIGVKDRNTGGVYGNKNPNDNDSATIIPLSSFGETGNHLFEYNKIHNNDAGIHFEAIWDRGSSVRYNLFYSNYHGSASSTVVNAGPANGGTYMTPGNEADYHAAAIRFKDSYLSPVAIYNNTFFENASILNGGWQVGAQHLVFNNIFGKLKTSSTSTSQFAGEYTFIEAQFPNRMFNSVFSAQGQIDAQTAYVGECSDVTVNPQVNGQNIPGVTQVRISNNFPQLDKGPTTIGCLAPIADKTVTTNAFVAPGAQIVGGTAPRLFTAAANLRWLETAGYGTTLPNLFKSTTAGAAGFLEPNWDNKLVQDYIQKKGWQGAGIRREDGEWADIGAIQEVGKKPGDNRNQISRARVSPFDVVFVEAAGGGLRATASIKVDQEVGTLSNLKVKYLAWVAPIPDNTDKSGDQAIPIPTGSIKVLSVDSSITGASKTIVFTVPNVTSIPEYGFFEIVLEGTANGKTYTTDVGFLPYRELDYKLEFTVTSPTTKDADGKPLVTAGQPVTIQVKAILKNGTDFTSQTSGPLNVAYGLTNGPFMYRAIDPPRDSLVRGNIRQGTAPYTGAFSTTYTVYFTKAGAEVVSGSGIFAMTSSQMLVFRGTLQLTVQPGAASKVVFKDPIPKSRLGGNAPVPITGVRDVQVYVMDKYDNPVNTAVPVTMESLTKTAPTDYGDIQGPSTVSTVPDSGVATFRVEVTNGITGNIIELRAYGTGLEPDTGLLRVGRIADALKVFYYESTPPKRGNQGSTAWWRADYNEKEAIDAVVGDYVRVWLKVVNTTSAGDTVVTGRAAAYACVAADDPALRFAATDGGVVIGSPGQAAFTLTNGEASFWITSPVAGQFELTATPKKSATCEAGGENEDKTITGESRGDITFTQPTGEIGAAYVKGDGSSRPTEVTIKFSNSLSNAGGFQPDGKAAPNGAWEKADSVSLKWPCDAQTEVSTNNIKYTDSLTMVAIFDPGKFPEGYSEWVGASPEKLVTVYGALKSLKLNPLSLNDSIGPLIADSWPEFCGGSVLEGPILQGDKDGDNYVIQIRLNETVVTGSLEGQSLLWSKTASGAGTELTVISALPANNGFSLVVSGVGVTIEDNDWIKLNPAHAALKDLVGNTAHADNRWAQLKVKRAVKAAYYTTDNMSGKADNLYITYYNKLTADSISSWFGSGASFNFNWEKGIMEAPNVGASNIVSFAADRGDNTVRVDLKKVPKLQEKILTGGSISLVGSKFAGGETLTAGTAADSARPVIVEAWLKKGIIENGGAERPDTLELTFSENLRNTIATIAKPVKIGAGLVWTNIPELEPSKNTPTPVQDEARPYYYKMQFVPKGAVKKIEVAAGDSVRINEDAADTKVSDNTTDAAWGALGIAQDKDNRHCLIQVDLGKANWKVAIRNNPFRSGNGDKGKIVVAGYPRAPGGELEITGQIRLYDNMGNLVTDTTINAKMKDLKTDSKGDQYVEWTWYGQNRKGRYVGTGTYLLKTNYSGRRNNNGVWESLEPDSKTNSIGVVRGRN